MNFSDCSKSRFDSLERKFRRFRGHPAKNLRITYIRRRVMSISFRDLNLGPNVVYYFLDTYLSCDLLVFLIHVWCRSPSDTYTMSTFELL